MKTSSVEKLVGKLRYAITKTIGSNDYHQLLPLILAGVGILGFITIFLHLPQANYETMIATVRLSVTVSTTIVGFLLVGLTLAVNKRHDARAQLRNLLPKYFNLLSQKESGIEYDLIELLRQTYIELLLNGKIKLKDRIESSDYSHSDILQKISTLSELTIEALRRPTNQYAIRSDLRKIGCDELQLAKYEGHVFLARIEPTIFFRDLDSIIYFPHRLHDVGFATAEFSKLMFSEMGRDGIPSSLASIERLKKYWGRFLALLVSLLAFSIVGGLSLSVGMTEPTFSSTITKISVGTLVLADILSISLLLLYIGEIIKIE